MVDPRSEETNLASTLTSLLGDFRSCLKKAGHLQGVSEKMRMFLLISLPLKHFNSFDMSHIFTESIAFRYIISKIISLHST